MPQHQVGAAWYSSDGVRWNIASAAEATWQGAHLSRVVPYHNGYVAVGTIIDGWDVTGAAWISDDGTDWHLAEGSKFDAGRVVPVGSESIWGGFFDVAVVGDRLIARGWRRTGAFARRHEEPIFRTSLDGETWVPATVPNSETANSGFGTRMLGGKQFIFIAGDGITVSRSTDGTAWSDAQLDLPANRGTGKILVQVGDGYVAFGQNLSTGLTWTSRDGSSWELVVETPLVAQMGLATTVGDKIVAAVIVGQTSGSLPQEIHATTTSDDGVGWSEPDAIPFDGTRLMTLVGDSQSVLLQGLDNSDYSVMTWLAQVP